MRLRPKVKELLPKIAEAIISIEIDSQYFRRWCQRGTLKKVLTRFGPELVPGWHFVDSTHVKVHADGSNPAGGQAAQAMGRTKGGLNTKIHADCVDRR